MNNPERAEKIKRQVRFGAYLQELRKTRGVSVKDVSGGIAISSPYLYQVEYGKKALSDPKLFRKLAAYYEVPVADLLKKAGYLPEKEDEEEELERRFRHAIGDPRFAYGAKLRRKTDMDVKRFIVEMYEKLNKK